LQPRLYHSLSNGFAQVPEQYAEGIVDTVREPLLILNADLRVMTVNRAFCQVFRVKPEETEKQLIYDLGNRQ